MEGYTKLTLVIMIFFSSNCNKIEILFLYKVYNYPDNCKHHTILMEQKNSLSLISKSPAAKKNQGGAWGQEGGEAIVPYNLGTGHIPW